MDVFSVISGRRITSVSFIVFTLRWGPTPSACRGSPLARRGICNDYPLLVANQPQSIPPPVAARLRLAAVLRHDGPLSRRLLRQCLLQLLERALGDDNAAGRDDVARPDALARHERHPRDVAHGARHVLVEGDV